VILAGRTALIVGGGRGIGAAVAHAFAAEGAAVFLVARTQAELEGVAESIRTVGGAVAFAPADAADAEGLRAALSVCASSFGEPDVLVSAAGVHGPIGLTWQVDADEWWQAQRVNVLGTLNACSAVIPGMLERGWGRIITFSGGGATAPRPRFSAYAASKAAVVRLTETLAMEVHGRGITVNAIAPGAVDTQLQDSVLAAGPRAGEEYDRVVALRAAGVGGVAVELAAGLAVYLATDAAASLTGKLLSAPHDGWRSWQEAELSELAASDWLTLRRLDRFTLDKLHSTREPDVGR
jgi:NAD(P)-dependent dehydrogenase (short-subunit alcohol dehydrogenase family)